MRGNEVPEKVRTPSKDKTNVEPYPLSLPADLPYVREVRRQKGKVASTGASWKSRRGDTTLDTQASIRLARHCRVSSLYFTATRFYSYSYPRRYHMGAEKGNEAQPRRG